MTKDIEELRKEADELGIKYNLKIGATKLEKRINEFYEAKETSGIKQSDIIDEESEEKIIKNDLNKTSKNKKKTEWQLAREAEEKAKKTYVVEIVDNDQRENNLTTVVSVSCSNMFFDLGTKKIPLNTPVEIAQGFINVLKEIKIPMHIKDYKTGQSKTTMRSRYSISYVDGLKRD